MNRTLLFIVEAIVVSCTFNRTQSKVETGTKSKTREEETLTNPPAVGERI